MPRPMFLDPRKTTKWSNSKAPTGASGARGNKNGYAWYAGHIIKVPVPGQQGPQANTIIDASASSLTSSTHQAAADQQPVLTSPGPYSYARSIMDEDEYATHSPVFTPQTASSWSSLAAEANMGVDESENCPTQYPGTRPQDAAPRPTLASYTTRQGLEDCRNMRENCVSISETAYSHLVAPTPAYGHQYFSSPHGLNPQPRAFPVPPTATNPSRVPNPHGAFNPHVGPNSHPGAQVQGAAPPTLATYTTAQALKDCNDLYKNSVAYSEAALHSYSTPPPASNSQNRGMQNPTTSPVSLHDPGYVAPTLTQELSTVVINLSAHVQTLSARIQNISAENEALKRKVAELEVLQAGKSAQG